MPNVGQTNAKCRYLRKLTCKGALRRVFYLPEAPPFYDPILPPPYTLYVYVYTVYLFTQERGRGGGANHREG
jgi:hypothetical protein